MKRFLVFSFLLLCSSLVVAQDKRAITFDDFISFGRVTDPQISPDGKTVAFVVTYHNKVENRAIDFRINNGTSGLL